MSTIRHKELSELNGPERAARYRELADAQRGLAAACPVADIRRTHLELAALWSRLAEQAEHGVRPAAALGESCRVAPAE